MVLYRWPWWAVKRERFDPRMLSAARLNSNWSAARTPEAKVQRKEAVSRMFDCSRHLPSEWEAWGSTAIPIAIPMTSAGGTWLKLGSSEWQSHCSAEPGEARQEILVKPQCSGRMVAAPDAITRAVEPGRYHRRHRPGSERNSGLSRPLMAARSSQCEALSTSSERKV